MGVSLKESLLTELCPSPQTYHQAQISCWARASHNGRAIARPLCGNATSGSCVGVELADRSICQLESDSVSALRPSAGPNSSPDLGCNPDAETSYREGKSVRERLILSSGIELEITRCQQMPDGFLTSAQGRWGGIRSISKGRARAR